MKHPAELYQYKRQGLTASPDFPRESGPEPLANLVGRFLKERSAELEQNGQLLDVWDKIIPESLRPYCRLDGLRNGILSIKAASGPCFYQLKTMSDEMVRRFHQLCPSARIRKIRLLPLSLPAEETTLL
ncbi:MAG TPA: DUF721 domain-containing protein [Anaerohalosphaeraceae bacterium]|nr:DUF721 domain-containing protein [Anaerohalosphaeraceae bacterium]HOL88200.1 DUF721 domain-containing protein [Anaerohalosphaeraceae bacterium]HPP56059.1 DUF721 domain-containing protein [Anaerohalosphaeraceae bacterium]